MKATTCHGSRKGLPHITHSSTEKGSGYLVRNAPFTGFLTPGDLVVEAGTGFEPHGPKANVSNAGRAPHCHPMVNLAGIKDDLSLPPQHLHVDERLWASVGKFAPFPMSTAQQARFAV